MFEAREGFNKESKLYLLAVKQVQLTFCAAVPVAAASYCARGVS